MSSDYSPEDIELMRRAHATATLIFPDKFKGKFFRDAAKRLARCANISYDEALRLLHAGAVGVATKVAEDKMKEVRDGEEAEEAEVDEDGGDRRAG